MKTPARSQEHLMGLVTWAQKRASLRSDQACWCAAQKHKQGPCCVPRRWAAHTLGDRTGDPSRS
jgi:hypothetical protein